MTVKAYLKGLRMSPRKVSEVASLVRGRTVDDALVILNHTPRRAAGPLSKLIASVRANATNNHGLKADNLQIETLSVTAGSRLKRYRPVSRGRAHPFQKRTSNVLIEIVGEIKSKHTDKDEARSKNQESSSDKLDSKVTKEKK